jgi:GR25 family glycosyltransferase involved in LPS biosynthesis
MNNFKKLFPLMIYINLDRREDRNKQAVEEFNRVGLSPERLSGTWIRGTQNDGINGIQGCMLSHIRALLYAKKKKQNIFIFEDDIKFINNYENIIESACEQLQSQKWALFYLGGNILKPFKQISKNLAKLEHSQSTVAYGVSYEFIDYILSTILINQCSTTSKGVYIRPIDTIFADIVIPRTPCFIVAPDMVVVQKNSYSDIEQREVDYESYLEDRYKKNFVPMEKENE